MGRRRQIISAGCVLYFETFRALWEESRHNSRRAEDGSRRERSWTSGSIPGLPEEAGRERRFDEFCGNLYHLNAEEEPELRDYPKDAAFRQKYGPRGVLDSKATEADDPAVDPRFGKVGKQTIKDTGPLTKKRMETIDDETAARAVDFLERQSKADKPFFLWVNFTHMHFRTHPKPESVGQSGRWQSAYHDAMIDHDKNVGTVLDAIDRLGLVGDTFVMYSTDNGPHMNSWPDAGMTPFRNEKNSNWEGAYRVPCMVRWPGKIKPGSVSNQIVGHHDWLPTFLAMAGDSDVKGKLLKGHTVGDMTYKVHLDGDNLVPYLTGQTEKSPREAFVYCNDDQQVTGLRFDHWKLVFMDAPFDPYFVDPFVLPVIDSLRNVLLFMIKQPSANCGDDRKVHASSPVTGRPLARANGRPARSRIVDVGSIPIKR